MRLASLFTATLIASSTPVVPAVADGGAYRLEGQICVPDAGGGVLCFPRGIMPEEFPTRDECERRADEIDRMLAAKGLRLAVRVCMPLAQRELGV